MTAEEEPPARGWPESLEGVHGARKTTTIAAFGARPRKRGVAMAGLARRGLCLISCYADRHLTESGIGVMNTENDVERGLLVAELFGPTFQGEGPSTADRVAVMWDVADDVLARGWHLTGRLHVLLWGGARGR